MFAQLLIAPLGAPLFFCVLPQQPLRPAVPGTLFTNHATKHRLVTVQYSCRKHLRPSVVCQATFDNQPPKRQKQQYIKPPKTQQQKPSTPQSVRLAKALATAGVASRRASEELIQQGFVSVNGKLVKEVVTLVNPSTDRVEVRGKLVDIRPPPRYYFALNKPPGYICSATDVEKGKSAVELLNPWVDKWKEKNRSKAQLPPRFFSVGRLDVASQGLLLLTNDGEWAQDVAHPRNDITKEYHVRVDRLPSRRELETIIKGAIVEGVWVAPVEVALLKGPADFGGKGALLMVVVSEGRKREVRVLVANAGLEVVTLTRVRIGGYVMPSDLKPGTYRQLRRADIAVITDTEQQQVAMRRNLAT